MLNTSSTSTNTQLWTDKHSPKDIREVIGNTRVINDLLKWLHTWDEVHVHKTKKVPFSKENPGAKIALLSGPPGVGKSTTATLAAKILGYDIYELNASDARSKKTLKTLLRDVVGSTVLFSNPNLSSSTPNPTHEKNKNKRVIIMDEVDGMSTGDRGGISELLQIVKTSNTPIIAICNERQKPSIRTLAGKSFDLRFCRPSSQSICSRLMDIASKEGLQIEKSALDSLIASSGNDIRQLLNMLQMWSKNSSSISSQDASSKRSGIMKDGVHRLNAFESSKFIFNTSRQSPLQARCEVFFVDYDLIPLMMAEHYPNAMSSSNDLLKLSNAADTVVEADVCSSYVRSKQRWDLLSVQSVLNVKVGYECDGHLNFPSFPEWLGKNSNAMKRRRMLNELCTNMRQSAKIDPAALRLDYLPLLRHRLLENLSSDKPSPLKSIEILDEYGMSRDDMFETLRELQFHEEDPEHFPDLFSKINSKTKASFTRAYNKSSRKMDQAKNMGESKKKTKMLTQSKISMDDENEEGEGEGEEEMLSEEDDEEINKQKTLAQFGTKTKKRKK